ncbi:hypothetical protein PSHT_00663 [Puccinia striiformis]|nr:hypothetical protein PSTG_15908 [Puccinia striiformis f. sp. tritici PST-78]POW22910.1 hypothetical protein PSHT_00663 [Puccinia striiformis]
MPLDSGHKAMCPSSECHLAPPSPPSNKDIPATLLPDGPESPTDAHHEFLSERMHYLCARSSHDHLPIGASFSYNSEPAFPKPISTKITYALSTNALLVSMANEPYSGLTSTLAGAIMARSQKTSSMYSNIFVGIASFDLDGTWWDCDYSAEAANAEYITCDGCSVSYP